MSLTTPETRLLTVPETAEALRVSRVTIYRLVAGGVLPAHRVGQQLRIDETELREYVLANLVQGAPGALSADGTPPDTGAVPVSPPGPLTSAQPAMEDH